MRLWNSVEDKGVVKRGVQREGVSHVIVCMSESTGLWVNAELPLANCTSESKSH